MALDITPLPIDETGNGERIERVAFDRADALMMMYALSIASSTAYMCDSKAAANRLRYYHDIFMTMVPPVLKLMRREEDVAEIAIAMATAETWHARQEKRDYWREGRLVTIVVGDKKWTTMDPLSDEQFAELDRAFSDIAPLTCVRTVPADQAV